jgi:hypothetical protein
MIGEELLRQGNRVRIQQVDARGTILREYKLTVASSRTLGDNIIVKSTTGKVLTLPEWDFRLRCSPFVITEDEDKDSSATGEQKKTQFSQQTASVDAQINKYIDDILMSDFDAASYAQSLLGIANRASKILELKNTILKMGLSKIPSEQRKSVSDILLNEYGISPEETPHETEANIQVPRAGRAGPST